MKKHISQNHQSGFTLIVIKGLFYSNNIDIASNSIVAKLNFAMDRNYFTMAKVKKVLRHCKWIV